MSEHLTGELFIADGLVVELDEHELADRGHLDPADREPVTHVPHPRWREAAVRVFSVEQAVLHGRPWALRLYARRVRVKRARPAGRRAARTGRRGGSAAQRTRIRVAPSPRGSERDGPWDPLGQEAARVGDKNDDANSIVAGGRYP